MSAVKVMSGLVVAVLLSFHCYPQGEIPVNMYTGTPGIFIPLYTITDHDLSESVSLAYSLSDLRLGGEHRYGVGWTISVGGSVSRKVRGLPDDFKGSGSDTRTGWLYSSNYLLTFPNSADTLEGSPTDETGDWNWINNLNYKKDTEPDMFSFSVGGQSGSFVFGNDGTVQLIPYQDILIVPVYKNSPTDMTIVKWIITTNDGVKYTLDQKCRAKNTISKSNNDADGVNETMLTAFNRDFQYYQTSVSYTSTWMLSETRSPSGANLKYDYVSKTSIAHSSSKVAMMMDATWAPDGQHIVRLDDFTLMSENVIDTTLYVSGIRSSTGVKVTMDPVDGVKVYDSLRSSVDSFKEFLFTYDSSFLTAVTETDHSHCNQMPPYRMYYTNAGDYPLPDGTSMQAQDFWGYFNGATDNSIHLSGGGTNPTSIPTIYIYPSETAFDRYRIHPIPGYAGTSYTLNGDAYRNADPNFVTHGTLSRLVYPTGGESDFTFESNKYWDAKANKDQFGGGLRVKSIVYYNGVDPAPNITKNFTYVDASGHSTGRLITRPSFSIPVCQFVVPTYGTNTGYRKTFSQLATQSAQYRDLTLLTGWDVSEQEFTAGSAVGYVKVTVDRPGGGKVAFDYSLPATYGDAGAGTGNTKWNPTTTKFVRSSGAATGSMGIITHGEPGLYSPFPNGLYDYERGLLLAKSEYNGAGTLVRYTKNTYQYVFKDSQPVTVTGLAYDLYAGSETVGPFYLYGRYKALANVAKVISSQTVTTYDENNIAKRVKDSTHYTYGSSYHRYPTKVTRHTPEGTVYGTSMKYTLDYPKSAGTVTDTQLNMILMLKDANRNAVSIEQQNTVKLFGGTEKTTGASLLLFAPFSRSRPLLQYTRVFRPLNPVTDFVPSGVTSNVFTSDSRYETVATVNEYGNYDIPFSSTGEDRRVSATLYAYNNRSVVAQVAMAKASEVAFSDFEAANNASFTLTNVYTGAGRTGATGIYPYATLSRTITKATVASKYILSCWVKNTASSSVTLRVTFRDTTNATIGSPGNYTITLNNGNYQYFLQVIDVSALPSKFKIEITAPSYSSPPAGGSSPSLLPMIDDVAFYPDYASIASVTYDMPFGPNSTTDATGMTSYTTYDGLGRVKIVRDKDNYIRKRFTYNMPGQTSLHLIAGLASHTGNYYKEGTDSFTAVDNSCISGELYEWNFGDGSGYSTPSTSPTSPNHSYSTTGNYTVTIRVSHPDYAQPVTQTFPVTIVLPPLTQVTCAGGTMTMNNSNVTTARYDCITPSVPDGYIKVNVTVGSAAGSTLSYQWKKRDVGASTWNDVTGSNGTYPQSTVNSAMNSFQLKCDVTASDGRTISSDVITVTINH